MADDNLQINRDGHREQLEELSKLTGQLAHEIKNPLSTIKVNLKLVSEELVDLSSAESGDFSSEKISYGFARAIRKISVIQKETDRLEQILDGFLKYLDKAELQPRIVDINELVSDMIDFYAPQLYRNSIAVRQGLYNQPLICKIDPDMIKQVILNLMINAQQAMNGGGDLIIRTDRNNENAVIQINDTGTGIKSEELPNIFNAYYSTRPHGSGLGLPTAKKIIEGHKGTIVVDSEVGKGTSFTIKLPIYSDK